MRVPAHRLTATSLISTRRSSATSAALPSTPPIEALARAGHLRDAVRSLILRCHLGHPAGPDAAAAILRSCAARKAPMEGRRLHAHLIVFGFDHDPFVCNHLINMYGKCDSLGDAHSVFREMGRRNLHSWNTLIACYCKSGPVSEARQLFDEMPQRDSVSWNSMIAGYDHHGPCEEALQFFVRMRRYDCAIDHFGVSSAISACSNLRFLWNGRELHGLSCKTGNDSNVHVCSALVGLYAKCSEIEHAQRVFDETGAKEVYTWNSMLAGYIQCSKIDVAFLFFNGMPEKNVVSWTTMVTGCSQHGRHEEAIGFFHRMREVGLRSDPVSFISALNACIWLLDFEEGLKIHNLILKCGYGNNGTVGSALVALYAKCGCLNDARRVIKGMPSVDDFSWSVIIAEYGKHGMVDCARELFEGLEVKSVPLWNALITGYADLGLDKEALSAFKEMQLNGLKGDEFTFGSLLVGTDILGMRYGEQLHSQTIKVGVDASNFVGSALLEMYSRHLECDAAVRVFNEIQEPNVVSWNSMISVYGLNNLDKEALYAFCLMMALGVEPDNVTCSLVFDSCSTLSSLQEGTQIHALACKLGLQSDVVVGTALVDMYSKCDAMICSLQAFDDIHQHTVFSWTSLVGGYMRCRMFNKAKEIFDAMQERNLVTWNTMLSGYAKNGFALEALDLFAQMNKSGTLPDHISFVSLLRVCCDILVEEHGKQIHTHIIKTGYQMHGLVKNALTNMYRKCTELPVITHSSPSSVHSEPGAVVDRAEVGAVSGSS